MMHVELQAICSALGYQEGSKYLKEPDCLESVKDLIRFLKHEDDTLEIRRQLGDAEILQNDLVPLVVQYKTDRILFESVIRLMVNLTQPARLCFNDVIPTDKTARNYYIEVEVCLRKYKRAFADEELFAVLTEKLGALLKLDWEHRHEEDRLLIERLLILVRNILIVPSDPDEEKRTDDDASLHDQLLWALHVSGMEDLLLYLANSDEERQYCMHTLEIISLMFREQSAEMLAHVGIQRAVSEKEKDVQQLEIIREQELTEKKDRIRKLSSRHSRFGGTYLLKNVKSISEKDVIYHRKLDQAIHHVSNCLAEGDFDELKEIIEPAALQEIQNNYADLSINQRNFLAIKPEDLFLRFIYEIGMMFDDSENQRFVEITVVFQGFHGFHNAKQKDPREYYDHVRENAQLLYVCNYRFIREFTKGATSDDWIINKLNHFVPNEITLR